MRQIYVEDGLTISFPGRDEEFDQGVEMGIAIALMAAGQSFTTWLSNATIEQAEEVAHKMNFHLESLQTCAKASHVAFRIGRKRPRLTILAGSRQ
jgi:hypothetical protein